MKKQPIGPLIRKARLARGLTQVELAQKCGMTQHHISRMETGGCGVSIPTLCRITKAMDATVTIKDGKVSIQ